MAIPVFGAEFTNAEIFTMGPFWKYKLDHVLFWVATVLFHMYTRWSMIDSVGLASFVQEVVIRNGLLAILIYVNLVVLIPRFARPGRWIVYGLLIMAGTAGYATVKMLHDVSLPRFGPTADMVEQVFYNASIAIFYVAFSVALALSREWSRQQEIMRQIAFDQVNTELAYLKSQLNPHFLFNSINTIYFQIDKENRVAREMLSTFSDMLRYQLYECNEGLIPIEKEVAYLRNYVDLQRMRKDEHYRITFFADSSVRGFQIAPLLLIPFVENAFKHLSHAPHDNEISIKMNYCEGHFQLMVINSRESAEPSRRGIGLRNVKRRLELLYPGRHRLSISPLPLSYRIDLTLQVDAAGRPATGTSLFDATSEIKTVTT